MVLAFTLSMYRDIAGHEELTGKIIECGIKVHETFGPGLLESVYRPCLALELREALNAIGSILGDVTPDDVLGRIFAAFCIGK